MVRVAGGMSARAIKSSPNNSIFLLLVQAHSARQRDNACRKKQTQSSWQHLLTPQVGEQPEEGDEAENSEHDVASD